MVPDVHLLIVEKHTVDSLDSTVGSVGSLVMNEAVAFGTTVFISGDFAR